MTRVRYLLAFRLNVGHITATGNEMMSRVSLNRPSRDRTLHHALKVPARYLPGVAAGSVFSIGRSGGPLIISSPSLSYVYTRELKSTFEQLFYKRDHIFRFSYITFLLFHSFYFIIILHYNKHRSSLQ